jgi:protein subunit release factor B
MISLDKKRKLEEDLKSLNILPKDLKERFILGKGKGGQKINKTSSCVQLTHVPSGIMVTSQQSRSREDNRFFAKRLLFIKLSENYFGIVSNKTLQNEKIRKQKNRRKRKQKIHE